MKLAITPPLFLIENVEKHDANLKSFMKRFNLDLTTDISEAEVIIYGEDFSESFGQFENFKKLVHLIPFTKLNDYQELKLVIPEDKKALLNVGFSNESVTEVVNEIEKQVKKINLESHFNELARYKKMIATELVQNSIIHKKENKADGEIAFSIREFKNFFEIEVVDSFGAIDLNKVKKRMAEVYNTKTYETKKRGAGFGLYMVASYSDDLCFEITKNRKSKVTARIYKYKRLKEFKQKKTAVHFIDHKEEH